MTAITISREYGSGGEEIALRVAEILGYQLFHKHLVEAAARDVGILSQDVRDISEGNYALRSFMDRLLDHMTRTSGAWIEDMHGVPKKQGEPIGDDTAIALVQKAVWSIYWERNVVILGRGGQAILRGRKDAFHVRVIAPMQKRLLCVAEALKMQRNLAYGGATLLREAAALIKERDRASAEYIQHFYGLDWANPLLYHLIINTGLMSPDWAAKVIARTVQEMTVEETAA